MNNDTLKGQWKQLRGEAKKQWGKLTDSELDQIDGQADKLVGHIQENYGIAKDEAQRQYDQWEAAERREDERQQRQGN